MPKTFDELIKVCDAVHNKDNVAAFTADKLHHWNWIPYLMGTGGSGVQGAAGEPDADARHAAGGEVGANGTPTC